LLGELAAFTWLVVAFAVFGVGRVVAPRAGVDAFVAREGRSFEMAFAAVTCAAAPVVPAESRCEGTSGVRRLPRVASASRAVLARLAAGVSPLSRRRGRGLRGPPSALASSPIAPSLRRATAPTEQVAQRLTAIGSWRHAAAALGRRTRPTTLRVWGWLPT
jgi:hypothetical protein